MPAKPTTFKSARKKPVQRQGGSATVRDTSRGFRSLCAHPRTREPPCRYCLSQGRIAAAKGYDLSDIMLNPDLAEWIERARF